jgi:hypothetical protein
VVAMGLNVGCLPRVTCYRHCLVFVSTIAMSLSGAEVVVVVATTAEALALASEGPLLLVASLLRLLFLVQSVFAWLEIFLPSPFT